MDAADPLRPDRWEPDISHRDALVTGVAMHSSRELRSSSFAVRVDGRPARIALDDALGLLGSRTPLVAG
jgi:hypothetical protein